MKKSFLLLLLVLVALVRRSDAQDPLDSLVACHDTQKLILENSFVRIIDDVIPPGVSEPKHRHPHGVVISLEDASTEVRVYPDGPAVRRQTKKGAASWNEALVHDVKNVGNLPTHFIRIDLKF